MLIGWELLQAHLDDNEAGLDQTKIWVSQKYSQFGYDPIYNKKTCLALFNCLINSFILIEK